MGKFQMLGEYQQESAFDVTEKVGGKLAVGELASKAVGWISENEKKYKSKGGKHNIFDGIKSVSKYSPPEIFIGLLEDFRKVFLNNPYIYENSFHKKSCDKLLTSESILCYLVLCDGVYVPLGVLEEILCKDEAGKNVFRDIVGEFLDSCMIIWKNTMNSDISLCVNNMKVRTGSLGDNDAESRKYASNKRVYGTKGIICALVMIIALAFCGKWLIFGVDLKNALDIYSKCDGADGDFRLFLGFITEKGYGINHNSFLNLILLAVSVIWLLAAVISIPTLVRCIKMSREYGKRASYCSVNKWVKEKLESKIKKSESELAEIKKSKSDISLLKIEKRENNRLFKAAEGIELAGTPENISVKRAVGLNGNIPGFGKLIFTLILVVATVYGGHIAPEKGVDAVNLITKKVSFILDERAVYAKTEYRVKDTTPVYIKPGVDSFVLYELAPDSLFYRLPAEENEFSAELIGENTYKIRFLTEYGYLSGWVVEPLVSAYSADEDESLVKVNPLEAASSRTDHGKPQNVCDGKNYTSWGVSGDKGGVGDYVELMLPEGTEVSALMIQTGNRYFGTNSRPTAFNLEFFEGDILKEALETELEDNSKKQYVTISKPVKATKVRFVIAGYEEGSMFNNLYITNLSVYSKTEEVTE